MTLTPNIGIYIPGDGEQAWGQSFDQGLQNIDQHDHSGAPNKGLPISGAGIADGSITPIKFNTSVFGTGTEAEGGVGGPITVSGVLNSFYTVGAASTGIPAVTVANSTVAMRTITGTANQIDVTNGNGIAGNPTIAINRANQLSPATGNVVINPVSGSVSILATSGNMTLESSVGDVLLNARTSTKTIIFQINSSNVGRFVTPAVGATDPARSTMLNLDPTNLVGINSLENYSVGVAGGGGTATIKSNIFTNQIWLFSVCAVGASAYASSIWYGMAGSSSVQSLQASNCTITLSGANIILTSNLGGNADYRITGIRLY